MTAVATLQAAAGCWVSSNCHGHTGTSGNSILDSCCCKALNSTTFVLVQFSPEQMLTQLSSLGHIVSMGRWGLWMHLRLQRLIPVLHHAALQSTKHLTRWCFHHFWTVSAECSWYGSTWMSMSSVSKLFLLSSYENEWTALCTPCPRQQLRCLYLSRNSHPSLRLGLITHSCSLLINKTSYLHIGEQLLLSH